jgi:hypothetical protein
VCSNLRGRSIRFPQSFYASARRSTGPRKTRRAPTQVKAGALARALVRSRVRVGLSYFFFTSRSFAHRFR